MKIPRIPAPDGISGKQWESGDSGKGSGRRPEDKRYAQPAKLKRNPVPGHLRIVYKGGEKITYINGVRQ